MIRRPPRSTLFPTRRSSDLASIVGEGHLRELALTGKDIDVVRAEKIGLVNDVYPDQDALLKAARELAGEIAANPDRKSTRLNSSHLVISYAVFCLKQKTRAISFNVSPLCLLVCRLMPTRLTEAANRPDSNPIATMSVPMQE